MNTSFISRVLFFICFVCLFFFGNLLIAQEWTKDFKYHDAGLVRLLLINQGLNWPSISGPGLVNCEYPPNSGEEHIGINGIWVGGITPDNDTLVSITCSWNPDYLKFREFYPTAEKWDTVWVVNRGDTAMIPYWPDDSGYIGFSDQDFVCRYSDYNAASLAVPDHNPLYVDVIQTSYAWSSELLNEVIVFTFYVIPTKWDLKGVYITYWVDPNVGYRFASLHDFLVDDYSFYPLI